MSNEKDSTEAEKTVNHDDDTQHDSESDEEMILEESPCGRWQKRRKGVQQQEVPGIDRAFLAMDTEEGVEVVWNEVQFSEKKKLNAKQEEIKQVFDNLINLDHANIAKLHKYWFDTRTDNSRVIFITEYMSSGSLKNFLLKAPKRSIKTWKRWTTQILSALSYLHGCEPPIIHGNLTLDMVFLQHNGIVKISSVAPDAIHNHVRTCTKQIKNMHYIAPEYEVADGITPAVDIYSFGICALGMITKVLPLSGDGKEATVTPEIISKAIDSIEDPQLKEFIQNCLDKDPLKRPTARELLFHSALYEVNALKLLAAHSFVQFLIKLPNENKREELLQSLRVEPSSIVAHIKGSGKREAVDWTFSQVPAALELEKFVEDVKSGVYPILSRKAPVPSTQPSRPRAVSPDQLDHSEKSETPEPNDIETRLIRNLDCQIEKTGDDGKLYLTLNLKLEDKMNRQLTRDVTDDDDAVVLVEELHRFGLINESDKDLVIKAIKEEQSQFKSRKECPATTDMIEEPQVVNPVN